jgi:NADH:ubiquinone oxidoreductase subunit 4 (subunit M)
VAVLAIVNVVYGSMVAMVQKHFKYVIGYSSVSHMGFVVLGLSAANTQAYNGAVLQMFSHGIMTGLLFAIVGRMVYDRTHTLEISELGGLNKVIPFATLAFVVAGMASMGMPGLSGFVAELQILIGVWEAYPVLAALCGIGIVVTAGYILRYIHRVFYGKLDPHFAKLPPITGLEKTAAVILMAVLFIVGLYPPVMTKMINSSVEPFIHNVFVERIEPSPAVESAEGLAGLQKETNIPANPTLPLTKGEPEGVASPLPLTRGELEGIGSPLPLTKGEPGGVASPLPLTKGEPEGIGSRVVTESRDLPRQEQI